MEEGHYEWARAAALTARLPDPPPLTAEVVVEFDDARISPEMKEAKKHVLRALHLREGAHRLAHGTSPGLIDWLMAPAFEVGDMVRLQTFVHHTSLNGYIGFVSDIHPDNRLTVEIPPLKCRAKFVKQEHLRHVERPRLGLGQAQPLSWTTLLEPPVCLERHRPEMQRV